MSGLLSILTDLDKPEGPGASFSDHLGGMYGAYGILAAIAARQRTGKGQKVETSLLEATIGFIGFSITQYLFSGDVPKKSSRLKTAGVYALVAGDGKPFVIHLSHPPKFWTGVTEVMGRPDLQTDPRTRTARAIKHFDISRDSSRQRKRRRESTGSGAEKRRALRADQYLAEVFEDPQEVLDRLMRWRSGVRHISTSKKRRQPERNPAALRLRPPSSANTTRKPCAGWLQPVEIHNLQEQKII